MNYFTPDLLERFGSEDDQVALAAQDELEQRSRQYAEHLKGILPKLPPRFREMQERFYLHDRYRSERPVGSNRATNASWAPCRTDCIGARSGKSVESVVPAT